MTDAAWVLLAAAALAAVADWVAVARRSRRLEVVAKPLATIGLLSAAVALDPVHPDMRTAFAVALALSLVGDVLLMFPGDRSFVAGLGAFLLAHGAYVVGFALGPGSGGELVVGVVVSAAVVGPFGLRLLRAVRRSGPALGAPVAAYVVVIAAMVACATGWGNAWAVVGAWLFLSSDALIGETRFVHPALSDTRWARVAIMVTYHLGQAGLVLSLVHP